MTKLRQKPVSRDDSEQSKRFIEAARELGPDETGEDFERAFKKVSRSIKNKIAHGDAVRRDSDRKD